MKKKINNRFIVIALFSIIITTLAMTFLFYEQLKKQVFADLEVVAKILIEEGSYEKETRNLRITVIEPDGTVAFDSVTDALTLENHNDRPEVKDAFITGTGEGMRMSDTLSESVFYYAELLDNGNVLRVGKEAHSVFSVFMSAVPIVVGMAMILMVVCLLASHYLTEDLIKPIEEMAGDIDNPGKVNVYPELMPFTEKIRTQHEEILATANLRQEFTANVSHELKTPLAAISGYAELMEAGLASEKDVKHFSEEIRKSAARLLTLINDIIKLSKLDAGNAGEVLENINLAKIAQESVEMMEISAAKHNVDIFYSGETSAFVRIGRELAEELVFNLIENAVRYNKPGGKVEVWVKNIDNTVMLSVEDTGIGISTENQERIFERFYRVDKSRSKELGGTGLGLAIVKHICMLTGGEINLISVPEEGTKITVRWANTV